MHVVGHQHIGVDRQPMLGCGVLQAIEVEQVIGLCRKDRVAVVPALGDVQGLTFGEEAGQAGRG